MTTGRERQPGDGGALHGELTTALLTPVSWVYGAVVAARNRKFDRGEGVVRLGVPVVSVGNMTVGGTGKSPVVRWIAQLLLREGVRPVIAMRGYGARKGDKSDETLEHEELLRDVRVDVLAQPDRVAALQPYLAQNHDVGCVILDDGFQHRRIARDLDIVLIDAQRPGLDDELLPAGRLREPAVNLRRAHAVIVTHAQTVDDPLSRRIAALCGKPPTAWVNHAWSGMRVFSAGAGASTLESVRWLRGKRAAVMAGLGNPSAFAQQVETAGAMVIRRIPVRDHQEYTAAMLSHLANELSELDALVTTMKDWVKVREVIDLGEWTVPIVVPELAIEAVHGEATVIELLRGTIGDRTQRIAADEAHEQLARKT